MMPFSQYYDRYLYECADGNACAICRALQGESFPIRDRMPGLNFPPMHPWCRCTFTIDLNSRNKNPLPAARKAQNQAKSQALELLTSAADGGIIKIEFETPESMQKHYAKHGEEYGDISTESYVSLANELVNAPASDDVEKIVRSDGSTAIYRFSTNDFLVVTKDGSIRTFFKPKNGKEYWAYEHERN